MEGGVGKKQNLELRERRRYAKRSQLGVKVAKRHLGLFELVQVKEEKECCLARQRREEERMNWYGQ